MLRALKEGLHSGRTCDTRENVLFPFDQRETRSDPLGSQGGRKRGISNSTVERLLADLVLPSMRVPKPLRKVPGYLWREWLKPLGLAALIVFPLKSAVADWNWVPTGSMKPTIL